MSNTEKLVLIDGTFVYDDVKEILNHIFLAKINFHQLKNFSSQERFGIEDEVAKKRIPELRKELDRIEALLEDTKGKDISFTIKAEVNLSF